MATFADDFNRANGGLGADWTTMRGAPTITGGLVGGSVASSAYVTNIDVIGRHEARAWFYWGATGTGSNGIFIKGNGNLNSGYYLQCPALTAPYTGTLRGGDCYNSAAITTYTPSAKPPPYFLMSIVWDTGHITCTVNGEVVLELDDVQFAGGTKMGWGGGGTWSSTDSFFCIGGSAVSLSADPSIIGNYGTCTDIDLVGTNTSWVAGTPGSPLFTVDHGSISAQTVVDETHATVTYCPGDFLGIATITDPTTGETVGITVTSDPAIVPPGDGNERPGVAAGQMLDDTAAHTSGDLTTSDMPTIMIDPGEWSLGLREALNDIWHGMFNGYIPSQASGGLIETLWYLLNGGYPRAVGPFLAPTFDTTDAGLTQIWTIVNTMSQGNTLTLQTILDALGAGGVSLQDILDAIGTSWFDPAYTLHDDLDYLDNRSDHSLDQIQTRLGNMWGTDHWSLSQIVGAISDPQIESFASLHNIYARLQAMRGDSTSSIANAEDWANLAAIDAAAAHAAIDAVRTPDNHTLQDILDAINNISIPAPADAYVGAPVWPGVANATVYAPYNIADGLTIQGPLHGLLFTITGQPAGAGRYRFGPHNSWTKCGATIFTSDRGDHERAQQFGLDAHIVCPKEMRVAASATLRLNTGWTGTVRRFTIN